MATRSVNGELHVESHVCLAAVRSSEVLQCQVKWRRLIAASVSFAVVEAEDALDFLGARNSFSDTVDLGLQVFFATYAARVSIALEAVGLHSRMLCRRASARVSIHSLVHCLLWVLKYVIALVQREDALCLAPLGLHFLLGRLDEVTSVLGGPANANMLRRQVRVLAKA